METIEEVRSGCPRKAKRSTNTITFVIPALNEELGIGATVSGIPRQELESMGYDVQILVVDNGSEDRTAELAREAGAEAVLEARRGYGRAYKTGFALATGGIVATADADHTYPVEAIPGIVQMMDEEDLDFVTTNRYGYIEKGAMSRRHRLGNAILTLTVRLLFGVALRDSQSGMWVFRKDILERLSLEADGMAFSQELKIRACSTVGLRWKEVPIRYRKRIGEVKLRSFRDGFENLLHLMRTRLGEMLPGRMSLQNHTGFGSQAGGVSTAGGGAFDAGPDLGR